MTLYYPKLRKQIALGLSRDNKRESIRDAEIVAGTATAGIPHAALVSDILNMPMVYVSVQKQKITEKETRSKAKVEKGKKAVLS